MRLNILVQRYEAYSLDNSLFIFVYTNKLMTRLELETSALPRRRSTDWATSAIQAYKPDKKHSIMMTYVCQLNFAKFFEKYKQL